MRNAIWAIFHHSILPEKEVALEVQHKYCPQGVLSWCRYWRDKISNKKTYNVKLRLPSTFSKALKPIFERLSHERLLERCQLGLTHNLNESFNNTIWMRCPKTNFCGQQCVNFAVSEAVCVFNKGAGSKVRMLRTSGIKNVSITSLDACKREDKLRVGSASRKITDKYKALCWKRSKKYAKQQEEAKTHYKAGGFDHTGERIDLTEESNKPLKRKFADFRENKEATKSRNGPVPDSIEVTFCPLQLRLLSLGMATSYPHCRKSLGASQ